MEGNQKLLQEYIRLKEQEEKKKRRRRAIFSTTFALLISGGAIVAIPKIADANAEARQRSTPTMAIPTMALTQQDASLYPEEIGVNGPFVDVEVKPHFPGGELELYRFLSQQIRYPSEAARKRIAGKVLVRFVIETDGKISQAEVIKGIGGGCDEEALRLVRNMPKWIPGKKDNQLVPVYSSLAINFKFL